MIRRCSSCGVDIDRLGNQAYFCSGRCRQRFCRARKTGVIEARQTRAPSVKNLKCRAYYQKNKRKIIAKKRTRRYLDERQSGPRQDAHLNKLARERGVDVVFAVNGGMFAIAVQDTAMIIHGGELVEVVKRRSYERGNLSVFERVFEVRS